MVAGQYSANWTSLRIKQPNVAAKQGIDTFEIIASLLGQPSLSILLLVPHTSSCFPIPIAISKYFRSTSFRRGKLCEVKVNTWITGIVASLML